MVADWHSEFAQLRAQAQGLPVPESRQGPRPSVLLKRQSRNSMCSGSGSSWMMAAS